MEKQSLFVVLSYPFVLPDVAQNFLRQKIYMNSDFPMPGLQDLPLSGDLFSAKKSLPHYSSSEVALEEGQRCNGAVTR